MVTSQTPILNRSSILRLRFVGPSIACTAVLAIVGGSYVSRAVGQDNPKLTPPGGDRSEQPAPRFNVNTTLVLIPATVTDPTNRFVLGLQKQDFHLVEDGVEQSIAHFSGE